MENFFSTPNLAKIFTLNLMVRHPSVGPERFVSWSWHIPYLIPVQLQTLLHHPMHGRNRVTREQRFSKCLDELTQLFEGFRELSHSQCNLLQRFFFYPFTCPCLQVRHSTFSLVLWPRAQHWPARGTTAAFAQELWASHKNSFSEGSLKRLISHKREPHTPRNVRENITIS